MIAHQRLSRALHVAMLRERARRAALHVANETVNRSAAEVDAATARIDQPEPSAQSTDDAVRAATVAGLRAAAVRAAQVTHAGAVLQQQSVSAQWAAAQARAERLGERYDAARASHEYGLTVSAQRDSDDVWHATRAEQ